MTLLARQGAAYAGYYSLERDNQTRTQLEAASDALYGSGVVSGGVVSAVSGLTVQLATGTVLYSQGLTLTLSQAITESLTDNATNWVWALIARTAADQADKHALDTYAGDLVHTVGATAVAPSALHIPVAKVVTSGGAVSSIDNAPAGKYLRSLPNWGMLIKDVAGSANVTLTEAEARNGIVHLTGALTGNIALILPTRAGLHWTIYRNTTGEFTVTLKTAAGTGPTLDADAIATVYCDGTDIQAVTGVTGSGHTHPNLAELNAIASAAADIDDAVDLAHEHTRFELLETYTQTEENLAAAVASMHAQNTDVGTSATSWELQRGYTEAPTADIILRFNRGTGEDFLIKWDETTDTAMFGLESSLQAIGAASYTFDGALVETGGVVALTLGTSLTDAGDVLNTVQGIRTVDAPTFAGLTLSTTPLGTGSGGTGGSTPALARTNLGVGTGDSPTFAGLNLGAYSYEAVGNKAFISHNTGVAGMLISRNEADADAAVLVLSKSRGDVKTALVSGDSVASLQAYGHDGAATPNARLLSYLTTRARTVSGTTITGELGIGVRNSAGSLVEAITVDETGAVDFYNPAAALLNLGFPADAAGYLKNDGAGNFSYDTPAGGGMENPMDAAGELIYGGADGAPTALASGTGLLYMNGTDTPTITDTPSITGVNFTNIAADATPIATIFTKRRGTGAVSSGDGVIYLKAMARKNATDDIEIGYMKLWAQAVSGGDIQSYFHLAGKGVGSAVSTKVSVNLGAGYVGIGSPAPDPAYMLDVAGDIRTRSTNSVRFGGTGSGDAVNSLASNGTDLVLSGGKLKCAGRSTDGSAGGTDTVIVGDTQLVFKDGWFISAGPAY
jgi:hypothetical protein